MSHEPSAVATDLIRWTFTIDPTRRADIESHLTDLGLDVVVSDERKFVVTWEEPDQDTDGVVEELWALHGAPFEVTQEEFHRLGLHILHHEEETERAVA